MKVSQMIGRCGALALVATLLGAQAAEQKTIKVVGLEDDKDNATVVAPPELGAKPVTAAISADALVEKAAAADAAAAPTVNTANVKALTIEGMVVPPSAETAKTLE